MILRLLALLALVAFPSVAFSQSGQWGGRTYTPSSFPRAEWCNCRMCQSLRAQWAATTPRAPVLAGPAVLPIRPGPSVLPASEPVSHDGDYRIEYRNEVRIVNETRTRQVKKCFGGYCRIVTETYQVPVQRTVRVAVRVPVAESQPKPMQVASPEPNPVPDPLRVTELIETPLGVVEAMLRILDPPEGATYFDLGSGDGRFLAAAASYGVTAVGVELDADRAADSRENLSGLPSTLVFAGDVLEIDLSEADYVSMYLYPELMEQIVPRLPEGASVVSYAQEIPGLENERHTVFVDGKEEVVFYARKGGVPSRDSVTFGL